MRRKRHWSYTGEQRRLQVLRRDNWECQIRGPGCLGSANTVDHIHPKAWGGTEDVSNLRAACKACNQRKGARAALRQASAFFRGATESRAPLLNISSTGRWGVIRSDYSRREPEDGDSAA